MSGIQLYRVSVNVCWRSASLLGKAPVSSRREKQLHSQISAWEGHFVLPRYLSDPYDRQNETAAEI